VIGEGGSGGALGIGVADRVYMLENTVYSVISPEGFASILLRDAKKAQQAAGLMRMTAPDLSAFRVIDGIIEEPVGGAHKDPQSMAARIKTRFLEDYEQLSRRKTERLLKERSEKLLAMGRVREEQIGHSVGILGRLFGRRPR